MSKNIKAISVLLILIVIFSALSPLTLAENTAIEDIEETVLKNENILPLPSANETVTVTVDAEKNSGLVQNINAFLSSGIYYLVLPHGCDMSKVYCTFSDVASNVISEVVLDFSATDEITVNVNEASLKISAVKSTLPVMYISIDETYGSIADMNASPNHTAACFGDMSIDVPAETATRLGCDTFYDTSENDNDHNQPKTVRLRGRGNSTWTTNTDKQRPYQLKLEKGLNLLGMGKNKTWALLRSETQLKYYRNKISYDMARDFGLANTPSAEMVDVILNGEYIGMYTLTTTVKVGKNTLPITDIDEKIEKNENSEEIDLTGGYLVEIDNNPETLQFQTQKNYITVKNPENLDNNVNPGSKYDYIVSLMTDLFNAVYTDGYLSDGRHFTEVLDMDSTVRYFLHQELIGNWDCCQGSTFFYKDSDTIDEKIYMGPVWDCDIAFELFSTDWCLPYRLAYSSDNRPLFINRLCTHKEFTDMLYAYYYENFNNNNIQSIYSSYADKISEYQALYDHSAALTSKLYQLGQPGSNYISSYISLKTKFMQDNLSELCKKATVGSSITLYSQDLSENMLNNASLYSRDNKLYFSYDNKETQDKDILIIEYSVENSRLLSARIVKCKANSKTYKSFELKTASGSSFFKLASPDLTAFRPLVQNNKSTDNGLDQNNTDLYDRRPEWFAPTNEQEQSNDKNIKDIINSLKKQ